MAEPRPPVTLAERLRGERRLELLPGATDGPPLDREKGCYPDGTPGPQLAKRMEREGYTRMRRT